MKEWRRSLMALAGVAAFAGSAQAADRFAVIVSGASGGPQYAERYESWRTTLATMLRDTFGYPPDHVVVLSGEAAGTGRSTGENVRASLDAVRRRATPDDIVLVMAIGHGTAEGDDA